MDIKQKSTHHKKNLDTSFSVFPGFALLLALSYYHHGRGAGATYIDEGVPALAPTRDQIRSVMTCVKLGRRSGSGLYCHRGGWRMEMEVETTTLCAFMWPLHHHKCPL
jgi:hypothetical protein